MARIDGSVTQGSADAFAEAELATALQGQTRNAYSVQRILMELSAVNNIVNGALLEVALTRRSKTAMPNVSDQDVITKWKWQARLATSGAYNDPAIFELVPTPGSILIVEDPLYIQVDGTSTSLTVTAIVVIEFEIVTISEVDRLTLLTQSLQ